MRENYTMTPINDPRKLELMRCAYQRAVTSCCMLGEAAGCPSCEKRFNRFYLGSPNPAETQETFLGWDVFLYDKSSSDPPERGKVFAVVESSAPDEIVFIDVDTGNKVMDPANLTPSLVRNDVSVHTEKTGKITSECLHSECWFCVGNKKDVPRAAHCLVVIVILTFGFLSPVSMS